jgi:hypothetical protein
MKERPMGRYLWHMIKVMPVLERPVMKERMVLERPEANGEAVDETSDGRRGRHYT